MLTINSNYKHRQITLKMNKIKPILILIFIILSDILFSQIKPQAESGYFKVTKIDSTSVDFYLIFLKKDNKNYTIYSENGLNIKGEKIKVFKTYYFDLTRKIDTLIDGTNMTPINYMDISQFGYPGEEIGLLCTTKDLNGLIFTKPVKTK